MKKLFITFTALLLCSFATSTFSQKSNSSKKENETQKAILIRKAVDTKNLCLNVRHAVPSRGTLRYLTSDYSLRIKGDSIFSYLPYFGRAYNIPYGGGNGLIFNSDIKNYKIKYNKKGTAKIDFTTYSDNAPINITITQYDNGSSVITVIPSNRETIMYYGDMEIPNNE